MILAKSIPAKKYGVTTGEPVVDALRKCPELVLVKPHHEMYKEKSRAFIGILQQYSDRIEQFRDRQTVRSTCGGSNADERSDSPGIGIYS